jgi:hypothetical protein
MSVSARRRLQLLCRWRGISQVRHLHSCQLPAIASLAWSIHHQTCVCYDNHHPIISDHHLFLIILGWSSLIVNHFWDSIGPGSERSQSVEPGRMEWEISRPWRRLTDSAILRQGEASADTTWRAWGRNSCDLCRPHQWFCDILCPEAQCSVRTKAPQESELQCPNAHYTNMDVAGSSKGTCCREVFFQCCI